MIRTLLVAFILGLTGCATVPNGTAEPAAASAPAASREFAVEARFALRVERPGETTQHVSGRLSWQHAVTSDRLLLANPFGQGLAELVSDAAGATLRLASGETRQAGDLGTLLAEVLGVPLPVGRLADWLLAVSGNGEAVRDAQGRLNQLRENGWLIDYEYDDAANTRPVRLTARLGNEIELRLRPEEWR